MTRFFLGLYNPRTPTVHSMTTTYQELIRSILEEVRSHTEFDTIPFTTIQVLHDTIDAPHTDDSLYGTKSIAMGLGEYVSGPLRVDGASKPIHNRNRAVAYDGHKIRSSGKFNGDRWSIRNHGFPCPNTAPHKIALPTPAVPIPTQVGSPPQGGAGGGEGGDGGGDGLPFHGWHYHGPPPGGLPLPPEPPDGPPPLGGPPPPGPSAPPTLSPDEFADEV